MAEFRMPSLGADMAVGTLVKWRRNVGDRLNKGDILAEVETEKGVIEVEVFSEGEVVQLLVSPGMKVPVGTPLAIIKEAGAVESQPTEPEPHAEAHLRISPAARRRARELGMDPATLHGTGPSGAITVADIELAASTKAAIQEKESSSGVQQYKSGRMRAAIAAAMTRSKREIPHYYVSTTIDMHAAIEWISKKNETLPISNRLLPAALLLKAAAKALRKVPELNAHWKDTHAPPVDAVHLGVAVSLRGGGLIAPAIHDAPSKSVQELMEVFKDLVTRARTGGLRSSELSDGTITVTSLGDRGVEAVFPIIFPPQVAIVGFGKIVERPWSVNGQVVSRPIITAVLGADHRVSDGHRGALFLAELDQRLQHPEEL